MKLEKKHWVIIGVVIAVIAIWYFFLRKKKTESNYTTPKKPVFGPGPTNPNPSVSIIDPGSGIGLPKNVKHTTK